MTNKQELIDQYHSGDLSPEQMADFENQLELNPELKAESDLQSEIIDGLKEFRKAELKSRLNAIDVSPGWMEFVQQSSLVKSFGGVAVATLIGSGVYLYAERDETVPSSTDNSIVISAPEMEQDEFNFDLSTLIVSEEVSDLKENQKSIAFSSPISRVESKDLNSKEEKGTGDKSEAFVPEFSAPNANSVEDDSKFESSDLDAIPEVTATENSKIDVITENVKNVNIKYKYYDGKLFLSGDFDQAPYEILEINSANGRRIYIQYLEKYYQVETAHKLSDLPEVTNQKLIKELHLLKENK